MRTSMNHSPSFSAVISSLNPTTILKPVLQNNYWTYKRHFQESRSIVLHVSSYSIATTTQSKGIGLASNDV